MSEHPPEQTPFTAAQAAPILTRIVQQASGAAKRQQCALLLAHLWTETSGAHCYGNNPGNLSTSAISSAEYYRPPWYTVTDASSAKMRKLHADMLRGNAPAAFRWFPTLEDGIGAYVGELRRRYRGMWNAAIDGDPDAFAWSIVTDHYTPDAPASTASTLRTLSAQFQREVFSALPLALTCDLEQPLAAGYC